MAALPSRSLPGSDADGKKKQKRKKPKSTAPKFDLKTELNRVNGVDLTTTEGIDVMTAATIFSEVGADISRFKTEQHFVFWAGLTPRQDVRGGKVIRQSSRRVNNRVRNALRLAANSLFRSESYVGAKFRKLRARRGAPKAIKGMARYLVSECPVKSPRLSGGPLLASALQNEEIAECRRSARAGLATKFRDGRVAKNR